MTIRLLYFAWVRERIGTASEMVELGAPLPLAALVAELARRSTGHAAALSDTTKVRAAINDTFATWDSEVRPGDEVALFPPVTGG